jgi:hypothetical protein
MNGTGRVAQPPVEVRREFVGWRLESQVLIQAYLLVVPVVRRPTATARMSSAEGMAAVCETRSQCVAQGA